MNQRKTCEDATVMAGRPAGTLGVTSTNPRGLGARGRAGLRRAPAGGLRRHAGPAGRPGDHQQPPPSAAELCARQVGYWAAEALKPTTTTTYGDYQKMGLAGTYYQLVLDISKQAKRLRKTATHEQTLAFIAEEAKRRCAKAATTCTTPASYNGFPSC